MHTVFLKKILSDPQLNTCQIAQTYTKRKWCFLVEMVDLKKNQCFYYSDIVAMTNL
jgi:hypothetical protein